MKWTWNVSCFQAAFATISRECADQVDIFIYSKQHPHRNRFRNAFLKLVVVVLRDGGGFRKKENKII